MESLQEALADQPIHVRALTRNNFFSLKIEIEIEKKKKPDSFLLNANFAKPEKEKIIYSICSESKGTCARNIHDYLNKHGCLNFHVNFRSRYLSLNISFTNIVSVLLIFLAEKLKKSY